MIPVDQTRYGAEGNCWNACLASVLEISLETIPDFDDETWYDDCRHWLRTTCECTLMTLRTPEGVPIEHLLSEMRCYCIVGGRAARGFAHAVVYWGETEVHDPHFSRAGLDTLEDVTFIVPCDPSTFSHARFNT